MKCVGILDKVLLIKVILLLLDKYILFQPTKWRSIFSITPFQIVLALMRLPMEDQDASKAKKNPHPRILAKPSTLLTLPIGTNSDLARLIFNWKQLHSIKIRHTDNEGGQKWPHKKSTCHPQTKYGTC
jgi:hypothetical protein